ncbi:MAG: ABC transporter permease [Rhodospirillaceae bacterium]
MSGRIAAWAAVAALLLAIACAPLIAPQNPYDLAQLELMDAKLAPGSVGTTGITYWLGTDEQGRDLWSAIVYGLRVSLVVATLATLIALTLGTAIGIVSAYAGGRTDETVMRIVDLQLSFPAVLIALVLLAALGTGLDKIVIALVCAQWAYYARTARGAALVERSKEYVDAARALGLSGLRIAFRHILPNCMAPLIVVATAQIAHAIALEATLSFLGLGVPITQPTLGLLVANGYPHLLAGRYWISFYPGIALLLAIVALNVAGDRLRAKLDTRSG